jgi:hypothetical protein
VSGVETHALCHPLGSWMGPDCNMNDTHCRRIRKVGGGVKTNVNPEEALLAGCDEGKQIIMRAHHGYPVGPLPTHP